MHGPFAIYWDEEDPQQVAREAEALVRRADQQIGDLQRRLDRLTLVAQALWELLRDSGACTEAALLARIEAIDLRDGRPDGRISRAVIVCPACGRNSNSRRRHCIYCERELPGSNVFDAR